MDLREVFVIYVAQLNDNNNGSLCLMGINEAVRFPIFFVLNKLNRPVSRTVHLTYQCPIDVKTSRRLLFLTLHILSQFDNHFYDSEVMTFSNDRRLSKTVNTLSVGCLRFIRSVLDLETQMQ